MFKAPSITIEHWGKPTYYLATEAKSDDKHWFYDIKRYLDKQEYPENMFITDMKTLRKLSAIFFLNFDILYKRNYDPVLLRCVDKHKAYMIIKAIHEGCEGVHANGHVMAKKILKAGYYWTTMEIDYYNYVRMCHKCQTYADKVHVPLTPLNVLISPWPFFMEGIDMIGMIELKASNDHRFILVAINYFTK